MTKIYIERQFASQRRTRGSGGSGFKFLPVDNGLLIITVFFILCGLIFTYSSSAFDSSAYFKKQIIFDIIGFAVMFFLSQTYSSLQRLFKPVWLLFITWGLLIWALCASPAANVHRWINLGFFNVQPSEIAKLSLIIYLAAFLSKKKDIEHNSLQVLVPALYGVITIALIAAGKDMGIPALMFAVAAAVFFIAGVPFWKMLCCCALAVPFAVIGIYNSPYRLQRVISFLSPEASAKSSGYQLLHSLYAIGSGGWFGKGLGSSDLKLEYLPAAHTDFIFAIICEEIGMLGAFLIILAFIYLLIRGVALARAAKTTFNCYLIAGITICLVLQAFVNMGVAVGLLPTKGLPLPFFSYGGSSVIITLAMMGILMNLAAQTNAPARGVKPRKI
jgi:cell division protein FtsW